MRGKTKNIHGNRARIKMKIESRPKIYFTAFPSDERVHKNIQANNFFPIITKIISHVSKKNYFVCAIEGKTRKTDKKVM